MHLYSFSAFEYSLFLLFCQHSLIWYRYYNLLILIFIYLFLQFLTLFFSFCFSFFRAFRALYFTRHWTYNGRVQMDRYCTLRDSRIVVVRYRWQILHWLRGKKCFHFFVSVVEFIYPCTRAHVQDISRRVTWSVVFTLSGQYRHVLANNCLVGAFMVHTYPFS